MSDKGAQPWIARSFLALSEEQTAIDNARFVVIPIPYDSTTSFRSGARHGPSAIIEASYGLEDYDDELRLDVSQMGIHTTAALEPHMGGPDSMAERIRGTVTEYVHMGRTVCALGGEHSITIGSVQAHLERYPDISVLYLDAHADLRDEYLGTRWGHASVARRLHERCPLVLVGVRSMCKEERDYIEARGVPTYGWPQPDGNSTYQTGVVDRLGPTVYVSVDLDVFDPSLMPAVGTPEPGGMDWYQVTSLLREVARSRRIVGFDVCELAPNEGPAASSYTAAKLAYKLIAYTSAFPHGSMPP